MINNLLGDLCKYYDKQSTVRGGQWYDLKRRVTKGTFMYISHHIRDDIEKQTVAIFLYRMGRGYYIHTVAELFGIEISTASMNFLFTSSNSLSVSSPLRQWKPSPLLSILSSDMLI